MFWEGVDLEQPSGFWQNMLLLEGVISLLQGTDCIFITFHAFSFCLPQCFLLCPALSQTCPEQFQVRVCPFPSGEKYCFAVFFLFVFFFGSAVYHPIPDPFFPVVSSPPEHKCHFGAISSAGTPHILTLFKIGIIKGFGYSSGCFSWFLGEVGEITCGQFPHSYQEPDGSHVFLI